MLHGRILRSPHPRARILRIDTAKARALPGVKAVITGADAPDLMFSERQPVFAQELVNYVGEEVAAVAAVDAITAEEALQLIEVEYEPLPVVDTAEYAHQPDAPRVHEQGNLLKHIKVAKGDVEQGFAEAAVVIERKYHTASTEHAFLEPECSIGRVTDDERYEIYVGSQIAYQDRAQVAQALGVPESRVRIIGTLIGGGFGGKEDIMGQIHVALLAKATRAGRRDRHRARQDHGVQPVPHPGARVALRRGGRPGLRGPDHRREQPAAGHGRERRAREEAHRTSARPGRTRTPSSRRRARSRSSGRSSGSRRTSCSR